MEKNIYFVDKCESIEIEQEKESYVVTLNFPTHQVVLAGSGRDVGAVIERAILKNLPIIECEKDGVYVLYKP
jgi:hypothetical protein